MLELHSGSDSIDLGKLLGLPVTVTASLPEGGSRHFNGIVLEASHEGDGHDANHYRLVMGPWLRLLELGSDCRIYQQKSVKDILESVFRGLGFTSFDDAGLIGSYDPLAFCVQYNETHARFVHRLMQRFGIAYHHDHTADSHKLVLCDSHTSYGSSSGYASVPYCSDTRTAENREHVSHWTSIRRIRSGKYAAKDYDYQQPNTALLAHDSAQQSFLTATWSCLPIQAAMRNSRLAMPWPASGSRSRHASSSGSRARHSAGGLPWARHSP